MPSLQVVVNEIEGAIDQLEAAPSLTKNDCAMIQQLRAQLINIEEQLLRQSSATTASERAVLRQLADRLLHLQQAKEPSPIISFFSGLFSRDEPEEEEEEQSQEFLTKSQPAGLSHLSLYSSKARRDAVLDELAVNIHASKLVAQQISHELDLHLELVDDLNQRADDCSVRLRSSTGRVRELRKTTKSNTTCVVMTVISLVTLLVLMITIALI